MTTETESTERRARLALHDLADVLAEHLTKESGEEWTAGRVDYLREDCRDKDRQGRAAVTGANFTRARDGFTLRLWPSNYYNEKDKGGAGIEWPQDLAPGHAARTVYRQAPGVDYHAAEPGIAFTVEKAKPATLARRMLRELTGPEYDRAFAALVEKFDAEEAAREKGEEWAAKVREAAGVKSVGLASERYWGRPLNGARVAVGRESQHGPGGVLAIQLPDDPDAAALMAAALRAVGEEGYKRGIGVAVLDFDGADDVAARLDAMAVHAAENLGAHDWTLFAGGLDDA
jgi:hypothetical protein